ncbi:hypothetical protein WG66_002301, partial [Moniliophthora roreri]
GTEIPREHFSEEEWRDFRWCSDTGSFNDADDHRRYVQRFLPPELSVSPSGEELLARTWRWLRGRHRYTASFMAVLMHGGFESPHHLLSSYVETIIHYYRPRDGARYMSMEKPAFNNSFEGLDFGGLENDDGNVPSIVPLLWLTRTRAQVRYTLRAVVYPVLCGRP